MTGYIWVCEECNGTGYHYYAERGSMNKHTIIISCRACKGRGYWEAQ